MSVKFFKDSDCDYSIEPTIFFGSSGRHTSGPYKFISLDKANRLLEERGKVVSMKAGRMIGMYDPVAGCWPTKEESPTHRALLICVEEIEKDDELSILKDLLALGDDPQISKLDAVLKRTKKLLENK